VIPVDEVAQLEPERRPQSKDTVETDGLTLDDDEQAAFDHVDSKLEESASSFNGSLFLMPIPGAMVTERVVAKLKKLWESGGWIVEAFRTDDGGWLMAFARPRGNVPSLTRVTAALQARMDDVAPAATPDGSSARDPKTSSPLLLRMPTRGRPSQALQVLARYRELAESHVAIEVVIDEDDDTMMDPMVLERLCALDCTIAVGRHSSKIDAVNGGRVDDWEILVLASDDMCPVVPAWDRRIVEQMDRHFPMRDGLVYFNDGYQKDHHREGPILCTLPIMGRHFWELFGYVYYPGYGSLFSDDEQTRVAHAMKRAVFVDDIIIEHRHHAAGKAPHDGLYQYNDGKWGVADRLLFETRLQKNFEMLPMLLSILICSTPARAPMLRRLVGFLRAQIRAEGLQRQVEICVDIDRGEVTIGQKRQRLLERAVGQWIAFVDDDDWVDALYVRRVVEALRSDPDCVSLNGVLLTNGEDPQRFEHALKYETWETVGGVHLRCPNHLNAVRRQLALEVGFASKNFGEDADYSMRLRPLLKTQVDVGAAPLYFYFWRRK
jgi:hypothetical protein